MKDKKVTISNICHKVVVTISDINCNYALPAFCGPIARPAREYDLFHAQIYILIAWSTAFVPRPWALLCRRSAWNRNAWPAWRIKSREGIVIRPFEGYIFLDMPGLTSGRIPYGSGTCAVILVESTSILRRNIICLKFGYLPYSKSNMRGEGF